VTDDQLDKGNRLKADIRTLEYECQHLKGMLKTSGKVKLFTSDSLHRVEVPLHAVNTALHVCLTEATAKLKRLKAAFAAA